MSPFSILFDFSFSLHFLWTLWKKLEGENVVFFAEYYVRLMVKQQITIFHKLLNRQVEIMQMKCTTGEAVLPNSHGSPFSMYACIFHFGGFFNENGQV